MTSFKNKIVLITGAASGIGLLMGKMSLKRGAKHLVMWDINPDALAKTSRELKEKGFSVSTNIVDIRDKNQVSETAGQVINEFGNIDILMKISKIHLL